MDQSNGILALMDQSNGILALMDQSNGILALMDQSNGILALMVEKYLLFFLHLSMCLKQGAYILARLFDL